MTQSRKRRGRQSELLLAAYEPLKRIWPYARAVNSGASGADLEDTPGVSFEVKARRDLNIRAALRQAAKNAGVQLPVVVTRLNGQGAESIGEWPVIMRLDDFLHLWDERGNDGD